MEREHCFEGYSKEGMKGRWEIRERKYLDEWPTKEDKRCGDCQYWANYYGNMKDFWCQHQKEHEKLSPIQEINAHPEGKAPSTRNLFSRFASRSRSWSWSAPWSPLSWFS